MLGNSFKAQSRRIEGAWTEQVYRCGAQAKNGKNQNRGWR